MLQDSLENLFSIPGLSFELALLVGITIDEIFDFTKDHFHEDGLWTSPSTKKATIDDCKQEDAHHKSQRGQYKYKTVLGPESHTQNDKFAFYNIEEEKRSTIDGYERAAKHDRQKQIREPGSGIVKTTGGFTGENPFSFTVLINGSNSISIC
jgi:hypothetical protein